MNNGIMPEPKDSSDEIRNSIRDALEALMGTEGLEFLDLGNAVKSIKQGSRLWQAPFAIGLHILPSLYDPFSEERSQDTAIPDLAYIVRGLSSQTYLQGKTVSRISSDVLQPLLARDISPAVETPECGFDNQDLHWLFHASFAVGVILLAMGDEQRATEVLRNMASTATAKRGATIMPGFGHFDVEMTKALAAIILQDFYARRQDYEMSLYLLQEAITSCGPGHSSESLMAVVPDLLDSFAQKCERNNSYVEWVDLFDRAAHITEVCGEADVSGDLPSDCKETSPQFMAWKFGHLVARFAIRNGSYRKQVSPIDHGTAMDSIMGEGGYGVDWGNGTVVASLLCEYDENRDWQIFRQQCLSMWESLSRYQWLSLCEAGTEIDLYWAMRIGFADQILGTLEQTAATKFQSGSLPISRDVRMIKDIASVIALRQLELQNILDERLPPSKRYIRQELQQRLSSVWNKLPAKVIDTLVRAENYYRTGVNTDDAKLEFNKAVEASLKHCLMDPLVSFIEKRLDKRIAICFPPPRGVERKTSSELRKLHLWEWSDVLETVSIREHKTLASLGAEDLRQFMKEHFGELALPALRELSRSLEDFCCLRKDAAHYHIPRHEEERQELEQMRELALGIKRPSVITQIFQLFAAER